MSQRIETILNTSKEELDITVLRSEIDNIDKQLVELLEQRMQLVHKVGEYKHFHANEQEQAGNKSFIRSGREAMMMRKLTKMTESYPAEAIIGIWRLMIASSLHAENPLAIAAVESMEDNEGYWLAREYFGSFVPITSVSNIARVVELVEKEQASVGVAMLFSMNVTTAHWWELLARTPHLKVFARVPFYQQLGKEQSVAFAFAHLVPEETGDDISLWVMEGNDINGMEVEQQAEKQGIKLQWLMDGHGYALFQVKGYLLDGESNIIKEMHNQLNESVKNIIPIGAYATPLIIESKQE